MAGLQTRKSVMALKKETVEGTPVAPASATDYVALQEGFTVTPSFEELTSAELQGGIGRAKSVLGSESPEVSFDHYLRHSGVEGQEPDYAELLEAAFGSKAIAAVEYDLIAGSTQAILKVGVGEGVNFQRGQAVLIKSANGYEIRNVLSVSGDDLTLGQVMSNAAPALGTNLGKACLYKPADEGHPTVSVWVYRANGGAVELVAGSRVSEMSMSVEAGQFINGSFSLAGVSYYFNPIEIGATDTKLDFYDGVSDLAATVAAKMYKDPHELASAIETAMNALGSADSFTCVYSDSTGKFTIATDGGTLSLKWNTGANTANTIGDKIGFLVAADDTGSLSYTSDNALSWGAPQTPAFDSASPLVAKANEVMMGDSDDISCFGAQSVNFTLSNTKTDIPDLCEESGKSGSIVSAREVSIDVVALLSKHDVDKFKRFREGANTSFTFNFGEKAGGNWIAGKCCNLYVPTATIVSYEVADTDGLVTLNMTLRAYVQSGLGEVYFNLV